MDKKFLSDLPSWAKGVIAVTILGGIVYVGLKVFRKTKKIVEDKPSSQVAKESENQYLKLLREGASLSFPKANYSSTVNTIIKLLDGCERVTTEEQVVEEIAKVVKKPIDWYYLISVFGKKDISDCGSFGASKTNYDLVTLLKDQLDTVVVGDMVIGKRYVNVDTREILSEYLKKVGVTF